jgi:t-SNARE complex subunit (syntaxin)
VAITGKEESKYQPYAQIEAGIKEYLEREKRVQAYEQEINKLIDQYKISRSKSIEAAMEEMRKQMNAAQPQGM